MTAQTATSLADSRVFRYPIEVKFGDCDPAGIVFYPNFYRWFDEAVHAAARACGWGWEADIARTGLARDAAGRSRRDVPPTGIAR